MAQQDRATLKTYFETGDKPTESEFADFVDSTQNIVDDGVAITEDSVNTLTNKTVDADNNTITNIGSTEIKSEMITGQPNKATPVAGDKVLISDGADSGNLKEVDASSFGGGSGDVTGPAGATDEGVARYDGATGKIIQDSNVTIDDDGIVSGAPNITNNMSTGWLSGGVLSINGGDPTKFDMTEFNGDFADNYTDPLNPTYERVVCPAQSGLTPAGLLTGQFTTIGIDVNCVIQQKVDDNFTPEEQRDIVRLGAISHTQNVIIEQIENRPESIAYDDNLQAADTAKAIGLLNESGNLISGVAATMNFNKSAGVTYGIGINATNNPKSPSFTTDAAQAPATFLYQYRNGSGGYTTVLSQTDLDSDFYDDGSGTLAAMGANKFKNDRVYFIPNAALIVVIYGQAIYNSLSEALEGQLAESTDVNPDLVETATFLSIVAIKTGATDSTDASEVVFNQQPKFAGGVGGSVGTSTATFQQTYDNSLQPQITTDISGGALQIEGGTGTDTDINLEILNNSSVSTATIQADGSADFAGLSVNGAYTFPVADGTASQVLQTDGAGNLSFAPGGGGGGGYYTASAVLWHEEVSNVGGGTSVAATWNLRKITNIDDPSGDIIASLAADKFTLKAGDYEILAEAQAFDVAKHQLRLYNDTAASVVKVGSSGLSDSTDPGNTHSFVKMQKLTANGTDAFRFDHYTQTAVGSQGLGSAAGATSTAEVYLQIIIRKLA